MKLRRKPCSLFSLKALGGEALEFTNTWSCIAAATAAEKGLFLFGRPGCLPHKSPFSSSSSSKSNQAFAPSRRPA